ncbi:hypothetical protein [Psittacicella hinzii]|uniref:hypothetical protein n=1 Tax=Psittacicella hinzii TaxID=2028575 RepID=UPI0011C3826E|nr:hypothetical protein [Psittacicella hinzii]
MTEENTNEQLEPVTTEQEQSEDTEVLSFDDFEKEFDKYGLSYFQRTYQNLVSRIERVDPTGQDIDLAMKWASYQTAFRDLIKLYRSNNSNIRSISEDSSKVEFIGSYQVMSNFNKAARELDLALKKAEGELDDAQTIQIVKVISMRGR